LECERRASRSDHFIASRSDEMTTQVLAKYTRPDRPSYTPIRIPSAKIEYAFYLVIFYSLTAEIWGISVPLLAGVMVLGLACFCLWHFRSGAKTLYAPIKLLFWCVASLLLVQILIHEESITDGNLRAYIIWILQLIVAFSLCSRPGFSHRYPLVLFVIAASVVPFLGFNPGEVERARVSGDLGVQGNLAHPNGLGEWFGFFAIYFAICGIEANRFTYRLGAWLLSVGCLFVVGLTVSRASLFGAALAITIGLRGLLKRGFVPLLLLITLTGIVYETGLFTLVISQYTERGMEETGRERLWPDVIERIFASSEIPLIGVGLSQVGTYSLSARTATAPHNTFLYLALSSGIMPLAFFIAFWVKATWGSFVHVKTREDDGFRIPYLIFTLVVLMVGDLGCMSPWGLLTLSIAAGSSIISGKQRFLIERVGDKARFGIYPTPVPQNADTRARSLSA
jgi:hypothetical protein